MKLPASVYVCVLGDCIYKSIYIGRDVYSCKIYANFMTKSYILNFSEQSLIKFAKILIKILKRIV